MAVIALKYPERLPNLLGYQVLIVAARMEHEGDGWLGYDHRFRQVAAAVLSTTRARIEPTLWAWLLLERQDSPVSNIVLVCHIQSSTASWHQTNKKQM